MSGLKLLEKRYKKNALWGMLVEVVKSLPNFEKHLAFVRDEVLPRKPEIEAEELSKLISIPLAEALVILDALRKTPNEVEEELAREAHEPSRELVALGGTFSRVHYGHLMLLSIGFRCGRRVVIGVTTDEFAKSLGKKYAVPPFENRVEDLRRLLAERGWVDRCSIVPLNDPYGIAVEEPRLEALITSPFTRFRGLEINEIRRVKGLKALEIIVCPLVVAWDGKPISSTRIILGEIDERGRPLA